MAKSGPSSAAYAADAKPKNTQYVAAANSKPVNLALQGGGAHGAFAWGVLDKLLEDGRLKFDAVSATSAGAMNATVLGYGLTIGGADGAREELEKFWKKISDEGAKGPLQPSWIDKAMGNHSLDFSPAFMFMDILSRVMSPYELNPFNFNPLRQVLESSVDFGVLREGCPIKLFLSATNVRTGKVRMFENHEIGPDQVLASGCLPFMFQTIEIDGEAYWDGGYMGNPAIFPLIYGSQTNDVVIVHINPLNRSEIPKTAKDILNRINEISFNSSLMREMRAIAFVTHLIDDGQLNDDKHRRMLIHSIQDEEFMESLGVTSKLNPDWSFMKKLRDVGRQSATQWLDSHFDDVGTRSSADIKASFL
ncbi:patatin-like phospholipase family protein [Blastomonas sp. SL216]|uniref:patatin-like phospholipase family protein n=1 Tax=Blastomonas sp. SL216 TaxID=2995169 RepID=UPI002377316F|nr:patatin-like phospholipase family protein [Blastomonas sp. SL216]